MHPGQSETGVKSLGVDEIKQIRKSIAEKRLSWTAGITSMSKFSKEERKKYLGLVIPEDEAEKIKAAMIEEEARAAGDRRVFISPAKWDWRSASEMDWTTPIKDQSGCGSCVAFATAALIESNLEIFKRDPYLNPDLSEADLFFRGCGGCCGRGWNFVPALSYAQNKGIPDEACFPYDLQGGQDGPCPDRDKRIIKITGWRTIFNASQAKEWISLRGPLMSGMAVYEDFFNYQQGIYKEAYGGYIGDHAICVVGYDDAGGYWICKNSWGPGWGEKGWFRIAYGESGLGGRFPFYTAEFTSDDDIVMPKEGRVFARFKERNTALDNEVWLHYPEKKLIFKAVDENRGRLFEVGTFKSGTRLVLALKTQESNTFYTDQSMNADVCDHVKKVPAGLYKWEMRWEDLLGLGEQDYNDVVMDIEIFRPSTEDVMVPKDGRVFVKLKSLSTPWKNEFRISYPVNKKIFDALDVEKGKIFDLGSFKAGSKLSFSLTTPEGRTYYTDQVLNPDSLSHVKKLPIGYNRWELRWDDQYGLGDKDFNDLIVEVEVIPVSNEDVLLAKDSRVVARFVSKSTPLNNEFWICSPDNKKLFDGVPGNLRKTFEVGEFPAGTRLVFAIKTSENKTYYTDSNLNPDGRNHVFRINFGSYKCQLRWEDLYNLADKDYNDMVVEITIFPK
jgi:C1A family cysteine protease